MNLILAFIRAIIIDAISALFYSGIISIIRLVFSHVTWQNYFYGAIGIFAFLFIFRVVKWIINIVRAMKDPVYFDMMTHGGISWKSYKKIHDMNYPDDN